MFALESMKAAVARKQFNLDFRTNMLKCQISKKNCDFSTNMFKYQISNEILILVQICSNIKKTCDFSTNMRN